MKKPYDTDAARWQALRARDKVADAHFVYAVKGGGVYRYPSQTSRLPRRENVCFFDCAEAAEAAGFRASKRVHNPEKKQRLSDLVTAACAAIEAAEDAPTLPWLAARLHVSPSHLHRVFKAQTGLTPKAYAAAFRARKVRQALSRAEGRVSDALYQAGFGSGSRFYEQSEAILGMKAKTYQTGGLGETIRFAVGASSLGDILVAQSAQGVCAILLGDDAESLLRELQDVFPKAELVGGDSEFEQLIAQVVGFIETPTAGLNLPLDIRGTVFQQRVWQALQEIPVGETVSYSDIAEKLGAPNATRAVAGACAANHLAIAIPCHRVVRKGGELSGYRWGIARKRALLQREKAAQ